MADMVQFEWAICEAIVLAVLVREWFSIRRELKRDEALRAAQAASDAADDEDQTPVPVSASGTDMTQAEGQQRLHPGLAEPAD